MHNMFATGGESLVVPDELIKGAILFAVRLLPSLSSGLLEVISQARDIYQ